VALILLYYWYYVLVATGVTFGTTGSTCNCSTTGTSTLVSLPMYSYDRPLDTRLTWNDYPLPTTIINSCYVVRVQSTSCSTKVYSTPSSTLYPDTVAVQSVLVVILTFRLPVLVALRTSTTYNLLTSCELSTYENKYRYY
jgi:hypothetical protein